MATRSPALASTTPRLATVELFPSAWLGLVTRITRALPSSAANCSEVRSER